jgi:hypothetical protein
LYHKATGAAAYLKKVADIFLLLCNILCRNVYSAIIVNFLTWLLFFKKNHGHFDLQGGRKFHAG